MKRIISWILILTMCLTSLALADEVTTPTDL